MLRNYKIWSVVIMITTFWGQLLDCGMIGNPEISTASKVYTLRALYDAPPSHFYSILGGLVGIVISAILHYQCRPLLFAFTAKYPHQLALCQRFYTKLKLDVVLMFIGYTLIFLLCIMSC